MQDKSQHWAFTIPIEEFYPIGEYKFNALMAYLVMFDWMSANLNAIPPMAIYNNRQLASKLYTLFKYEIEEYLNKIGSLSKYMQANPHLFVFNKEITKPPSKKAKSNKQKGKKAVKNTKAFPANVVNFEEFKNERSKAS